MEEKVVDNLCPAQIMNPQDNLLSAYAVLLVDAGSCCDNSRKG
jgi:hypothetical protein